MQMQGGSSLLGNCCSHIQLLNIHSWQPIIHLAVGGGRKTISQSLNAKSRGSGSGSGSVTLTAAAEPQGNGDPSYSSLPKLDRSGRFCSPRAGRELALSILFAACLEGSDPVRLFEKRLNAPREPGYEFDKSCLLEYDHMRFGGPPVSTPTVQEADQLLRQFEAETANEATVLAAPPKLVYSKLLLRFTKKLLSAVVDKWDINVLVINKITPLDWKTSPAGRILEFSILHLAMSEISVLGTQHPIVINEAVDLAKRFCDGAAPRVINGCLRTFVRDHLVPTRGSSSMVDL